MLWRLGHRVQLLLRQQAMSKSVKHISTLSRGADPLVTNEPVRVFFPLEQDENGYPPVTCEMIWCLPATGSYVVDNIPFYARDISLGDEVQTELRDGELWFVGLATPSKNTTVRGFARNGIFAPLLIPQLQAFGGVTEKMEGSDLVAISFSPSSDIAGALDYLDRETKVGNVAFEESSVRYR
jgi:hypothetical protein